ncbi:MAG: tRNA pseudouridine(38-40) synthase TruA [Desulfobulbus propionicus]|nr:MAG: tRNA pseudouridine(38-40) synthase TruA [Desulfobulbus propionicus]
MGRKIKLVIAYDGTEYHGWQRQRNGSTVQEVVENALAILCKQPVTLHGAGRTDAGVHADGMVAHFLEEQKIPLHAYTRGLNSILPGDVRVYEAEEAADDFHSRFSVLGKTYRYDFFTGEIQPPAKRRYTAHFPGDFSSERIVPALKALIGTHDFSSFERAGSRDRNSSSGRGAVRTIFEVKCTAHLSHTHYWSLRVTGDGFLRQMVRIICGTLIDMGCGRLPADTMSTVIAARDRASAGITAPAHGLYLERVYYKKLFER